MAKAVRKKLAALITVISLAAAPAGAGDGSCDLARDVMKLHFELYAGGQERLIASALDRIFKDPSFWEGQIPDRISFGADPECKSVAAVEKMVEEHGAAYVNERCIGLPYLLLPKKP